MLDIKKNYLSHFPEFGEESRTLGTNVFPVYEEGKPNVRRKVTVLESNEVKQRHAEVRAELGLGRDLKPIQPSPSPLLDDTAGDPNYYESTLNFFKIPNLGWEDL